MEDLLKVAEILLFAVSFFPPFFTLQGFEDCLVFDELMDKFNNDLSKYNFSNERGPAAD